LSSGSILRPGDDPARVLLDVLHAFQSAASDHEPEHAAADRAQHAVGHPWDVRLQVHFLQLRAQGHSSGTLNCH